MHLLKNLRTRIIDNKIILFKGSKIFIINRIGEILDLKDVVIRGRETIRNDFAIRLINDKNITIFGENEEYCNLIFMLQFVLFTIVIQSENLSIDFRTQFRLLSYGIIVQIAKESEKLPQQRSKYTENVAYLLYTIKIRTLNTIIGVVYPLHEYGNDIIISRLGTHIVEFIFRRMRNGC